MSDEPSVSGAMYNLTLHRQFTLTSASTYASVHLPAGTYKAVTAPNHWRSNVLWLVLLDTDIGCSYQWLRTYAQEYPETLSLTDA